MQTYPDLNATNPAERSTDRWTLTAPSSSNVGFISLTAALVATIGLGQFVDALSRAPTPLPDAGLAEELYAFDALPDLEDLAKAQGVQPINDIDDLATDFWPEDESVEDFIAAATEWRHEEDELDS
jgi:hypothetical protein